MKDKIVLRRRRKVLPWWVQSQQMKSEEKLVIDVTLVHTWCWTDDQQSDLSSLIELLAQGGKLLAGFWEKGCCRQLPWSEVSELLTFRKIEALLYIQIGESCPSSSGVQCLTLVFLDISCWWVWQASMPDVAEIFASALSSCLPWECECHLW